MPSPAQRGLKSGRPARWHADRPRDRHGPPWPLTLRSLALSLAACVCTDAAVAADRWVARLANREVVRAADIEDWNDPKANPRIAGRSLNDPGNPVVSLIDLEGAAADRPTTCLEFVGGDRLIGEVVGFRQGSQSPYEALPPHLLVRTTADFQPPDYPSDNPLRVTTRWLRKIVWNAVTGTRYVPATAWLSSGGQVAFRSLRWTDQGIALLTESGLRSYSFAEIAELHLPAADAWAAYEDQLATLSPKLDSRLLQIESHDGGRLTTSMERFQARHWGDKKRPESWLQIVQPAWSLEALWVRFSTVSEWFWFDPAEPPLSWCDPSRVDHQAVFGGGWSWHRDRSSLGERFLIVDQHFHRGFGVHGSTDLTFVLPAYARDVRTRCGLDTAAAEGGCVKLSVIASDGREQFATDPLIGSTRVLDTDWLPVSAVAADIPPSITFRSDMLARDAPRGTDPFDIRDVVDWVDPQVRLDRNALLGRVTQGDVDRLPGLHGWTLLNESADLDTRVWFDESESRDPQFRLLWSTTQPYALFSRSLRVTATDRWISLIASRFEKSSQPTQLQLKIDGRSAGEFEIPIRYGPIDPLPITVPLPPGPARTVQLELTVYSPGPDCWWDWRGVMASADLPGILTLYDETATELLAEAGDRLHADGSAPFAGRQSLRVEAGRVDLPQVESLTAAIVDLPRLGQYRFLTFAWKGSETPGLAFWLAYDGRIGPEIASGFGLGPRGNRGFRSGNNRRRLEDRGLKYGFAYDIGSYKPAESAPLRIDRKTPAEWRFETRDVAGDFGPVSLTGFSLECAEAGRGWFDAIALARTPEDLEVLKRRYGPPPKPNADGTYSQIASRREEWGPAIAEFAPHFATPSADHGVLQRREHQGQAGGWQTHPNGRDKPFVLRTAYRFPQDRAQELDILVSNQPGSDFRLVVRVNGETIHEELINDELTRPQRGYASLQVDLSKFQGQTGLIEVLNASNDWSNEHAVWKRVQIRDR